MRFLHHLHEASGHDRTCAYQRGHHPEAACPQRAASMHAHCRHSLCTGGAWSRTRLDRGTISASRHLSEQGINVVAARRGSSSAGSQTRPCGASRSRRVVQTCFTTKMEWRKQHDDCREEQGSSQGRAVGGALMGTQCTEEMALRTTPVSRSMACPPSPPCAARFTACCMIRSIKQQARGHLLHCSVCVLSGEDQFLPCLSCSSSPSRQRIN
jgi:hypothetical protein